MIDCISENKIVSLIKEAHNKLVVISPALSIGVAEAIRDKAREGILENISIIVDLDANVYRMGFGDEKALDLLKEFLGNERINISKQKGLRVGVIVADDKVLFYAPTAKMVEADPISENGTSLMNGFVMTDDLFCNQAQSEGKASPIAAAIINEVEGNSETGQQPTIGLATIKEENIMREQESLEKIPPKPFDIQRRIDVYSSKLTFVEFTISFEKYSVKKINIPKSITIVKDKKVDERLLSQLTMFQEMKDFHTAIPKDILENCNEKMKKELGDLAEERQNTSERKSTDGVDLEADDALCETSIKAMGDWIRNKYTIHINDEYGNAMLYEDKESLRNDLAWLQRVINHYHNECAKELMHRSAEVVDHFAHILVPIAKENPSPQLKAELANLSMFKDESEDSIIFKFIRRQLSFEVGKITLNAEKKSEGSKEIKAIFKNISFDSINNEDEFLDKLRPPFVAKFGEKKFNELFHIEEVAKGKQMN